MVNKDACNAYHTQAETGQTSGPMQYVLIVRRQTGNKLTSHNGNKVV